MDDFADYDERVYLLRGSGRDAGGLGLLIPGPGAASAAPGRAPGRLVTRSAAARAALRDRHIGDRRPSGEAPAT
jgi:hypothetical protein